MKQQKKAFSLIIGMMIVLASMLLAYTVLEFMLPFSKNLKGVENSANAYYQANSGVERTLYFLKTRKGEKIKDNISGIEYVDGDVASHLGKYDYATTSAANILPVSGSGTSSFDRDYNTIATGDPIQLSIGNNFIENSTKLSKLKIKFRAPDISGLKTTFPSLKTGSYIMWQLSSENGGTIYAQSEKKDNSGVKIRDNELISQNKISNTSIIVIKDLVGFGYDNVTKNEVNNIKISNVFFGTGHHNGVKKLDCENQKCTLTFQIIRELKTAGPNSKTLPFLEWQINTQDGSGSGGFDIPLRYTNIKSKGEYLGFGRELDLRYPQETANQALSITVLQ